MLKKVVALVALIMTTAPCSAQEQAVGSIRGMFGVTLGESSSSLNVIERRGERLRIKPSSPHSAFHAYHVETTPGGRIRHVEGYGILGSMAICERIAEEIETTLASKYNTRLVHSEATLADNEISYSTRKAESGQARGILDFENSFRRYIHLGCRRGPALNFTTPGASGHQISISIKLVDDGVDTQERIDRRQKDKDAF